MKSLIYSCLINFLLLVGKGAVSQQGLPLCPAHIPFAFDVSKDLTPTQFASQISLITDYLLPVFSPSIRPSPICAYDMSPYLYTPVNVSDVARIVSVAKQSSTAPTISLAIKTLAQKTYDNDLPWNLIIFVGSTPTSYNVQAAWDSIYSMSEQGVNVIVVPLTSQIDLLTLEQWPNIFISEYNDNIQVVASNIRNILKCQSTNATTLYPPTLPASLPTVSTSSDYLPCQRYINIILDNSISLSLSQFQVVKGFVYGMFNSYTTHFERFGLGYSNEIFSKMYSYGSFQNYWDIIKALDGITQYGANFVLETALKQIDTEYQANSTIGLSTLLFITSIANSNLTAAKPYADSLRSKGRLTFITVSMQQNDIANLSRLADQIINWDASNFYYPPDALSQLQNAFDCPAQPPFAFNFTQCRTTYANYFMFDASNDLNETDFQNQKQFFLDNLYTTISPIVSPMLYLYGYDNVSANYVSCDQYDMLCIPAMTQQIIQTNNTPSFYNAMYQTSDYRRAVNFIIFISSTPADWEIQQSISILNSILSYNGRVIVVSNNDQVDQSQLLKLNGISIAPYQENRMEQGEIIRKQMTCQ